MRAAEQVAREHYRELKGKGQTTPRGAVVVMDIRGGKSADLAIGKLVRGGMSHEQAAKDIADRNAEAARNNTFATVCEYYSDPAEFLRYLVNLGCEEYEARDWLSNAAGVAGEPIPTVILSIDERFLDVVDMTDLLTKTR